MKGFGFDSLGFWPGNCCFFFLWDGFTQCLVVNTSSQVAGLRCRKQTWARIAVKENIDLLISKGWKKSINLGNKRAVELVHLEERSFLILDPRLFENLSRKCSVSAVIRTTPRPSDPRCRRAGLVHGLPILLRSSWPLGGALQCGQQALSPGTCLYARCQPCVFVCFHDHCWSGSVIWGWEALPGCSRARGSPLNSARIPLFAPQLHANRLKENA